MSVGLAGNLTGLDVQSQYLSDSDIDWPLCFLVALAFLMVPFW